MTETTTPTGSTNNKRPPISQTSIEGAGRSASASIIASVEREVARILGSRSGSGSSEDEVRFLNRRRSFVDKETDRVSRVMLGGYKKNSPNQK